jgi:hypothetical protein
MLLRFMEERKITRAGLYKDADIDRKLIYKILKQKDYQPKKGTAVRLALGLRLSLEETKALLEAAGFALSRSIRKDCVVSDCIARNRRTVWEVNRVLRAYGLGDI